MGNILRNIRYWFPNNCRTIVKTALTIVLSMLFATYNAWSKDRLFFENIPKNFEFSNKRIKCIVQDDVGFMWFGTFDGLFRYDGHETKSFRPEPNNYGSISSPYITSLIFSSDSILWVGTSTGVNIYNRINGTFSKLESESAPAISREYVMTMLEDSRGTIWIGSQDIYYIDRNRKDIVYVPIREMANISLNSDIRTFEEDRDGNIWIGTSYGLFKYSVGTGELTTPYTSQELKNFLDNNVVSSLKHDPSENSVMWIGTEYGLCRYDYDNGSYKIYDTGNTTEMLNNIIRSINYLTSSSMIFSTDVGVYTINKESGAIDCYRHNMVDYSSVANDLVQTIYRAPSGIVWLGTELGVSYINPDKHILNIKQVLERHGDIISKNRTNDIMVDNHDNVWLATSDGVLKVPNDNNLVINPVKYDNGLAHKLVRDIHIDMYGTLWAGTDNGLHYLDEDKKRFIKVETGLDPIFTRYVTSIAEDKKGNIWFSVEKELCRVLPERNPAGKVTGYTYKLYKTEDSETRFSPSMVKNDRHNNIWTVTRRREVYRYNEQTDKIEPQKNSRGELYKIDFRRMQCMIISEDNAIYGGTSEGLYKFDFNTNSSEKINLGRQSDLSVLSVIEQGPYLYVATTNGILMHNKSNGQTNQLAVNYNPDVMNFVNHSHFASKNGIIYLGGFGAYFSFDPAVVTSKEHDDRTVIITKLIANKQDISATGEMPMEEVPILSDNITLSYKKNSFKIHFSLLDYQYPQGNSYRYILEGFDKGWNVNMNGDNIASYVNIPPGRYKFKVNGTTNAEYWNDNAIKGINIRILPPWWASWWAILIYILVILSLTWFFLRMALTKLKLHNELEYQQIERDKSEELNQLKLRFFTNISHEFRTPITLILDPVNQIFEETENESHKKMLSIMKANGNRLLRLVNQILDFRKVEYQMMKLELSYGDIVPFVSNIFNYFTDNARQHNITYKLECRRRYLYTMFDKDKLEKVLYNLLSNAFKHTPDKGEISITVDAEESGGELCYCVTVKDNGTGIEEEELPYIFDRFYQVRSKQFQNATSAGTGIGLMLCKEYVEMHKGNISVTSEQDNGSKFKITIPIVENPEASEAEHTGGSLNSAELKESYEILQDNDKPTVLFVEDNQEMREYVMLNWGSAYNVITAQDGIEGWEMTKIHNPDLIISDIMMPNMNGVELCRKVKTEFDAHMPVILLTAKTDQESIFEGLKHGADDYIVKPFSIRMLKLRASKLIESRKMLQEYYKNLALKSPKTVIIETDDDKFIVDFVTLIENNMDNPELKIDFITEKMDIQRHQLYRRIKSLTGVPVNEFIRSIRIERAAQLFKDTSLNISEVMYRCGFSGMSYFYKCFEEKYSVKPAEYISKYRKKNN